jgi:glucosamine-6-phosphate deaminase
MKVIITKDAAEMSRKAAEIFADRIRKKPNLVLGLATGSTPERLYAELAKMNRAGRIDCSGITTFNLDEYVGIPGDHDQSYRDFMNRKLFNRINICKQNTHVLNGMAFDPKEECKLFELAIKGAGGIDLQLLGIGSNGHIAFNEPGSPKDSRTRVVKLTKSTIKDNSRFFKDISEVPTKALSMGNGTILEAKEIVLIAHGKGKAQAIAKAIEGPMTEDVPASLIQKHRRVTFIVDEEAASLLTKTRK